MAAQADELAGPELGQGGVVAGRAVFNHCRQSMWVLMVLLQPAQPQIIDKTQFNPASLQEKMQWALTNLKAPFGDWLNSTLPSTAWTTITRYQQDGLNLTYIITGDIPAMWFRDSYNQVEPYLKHLDGEQVREMVAGLIRLQARLMMHDPYPNAYYKDPTSMKPYNDNTSRLLFQHPFFLNQRLVHQRKYEIDSVAFFLKLINEFHQKYPDYQLMDSSLLRALRSVRQLIYQQMDDKRRQEMKLPMYYYFQRDGFPAELQKGMGAVGGTCGLVRSGFRPSDDPVARPYNIPGNSLLSIQLRKMSMNFFSDILQKSKVKKPLQQLKIDFQMISMRIESSLKQHGTTSASIKQDRSLQQALIYAQQTDCKGGFTLGDDPNLPSLMALPLYNSTIKYDPIYINTRQYLYSTNNRLYFKAGNVDGLGSTHTPFSYIWPLGIITRMLTSDDPAQVQHCLDMLVLQDGKVMHESFNVASPKLFTRNWFAWANSMFSHALLTLASGAMPSLILDQKC